MFLFKKLLAPFFFPLPLCLAFLGLGLMLLWCTRRQRAGRTLVTLGTLLLALFSFSPFPDFLLEPLERQYSQVNPADLLAGSQPDGAPIKWIVALGGGVNSDPELSPITQLSYSSLVRLLEAIRLQRELPGSKLLVSGGGGYNKTTEAAVMARVALDLGVKREDLVLEAESWDTEDQARLIKPLVGKEKFILVTSASHLPRAAALFRKQGMNPICWPAGHLVERQTAWNPHALFPWSQNLSKAEAAFYEYLGLTWAKLRGAI